MNKITSHSQFFYNVLEDYKRTTSSFSSRIKQDLNKEISTSSDYRGREIYELLQNAEDEMAEFIKIHLDCGTQTLSVSNGGSKCKPFSEKGFCSIMMAEMSPKLEHKQSYIGNKGLGFRSILNWAEEIKIYSSGVCCTFSPEIAEKNWIANIRTKFSDDLIKEHEEFAKIHNRTCPVATLAIPTVEDAQVESDITTRIVIRYKKECEESIKDQINSLSGKVLLFLSNIKKIDIQVDLEHTTIKKEVDSENSMTVYDSTHPNGIAYTIFSDNDICEIDESKKYEIKIAYTQEDDKEGEYIYTFFPTKVRIGLPCVIHATFDLNSSRNALNETELNTWMQGKIAECLISFAKELALNDNRISWDYVQLLTLNEYDKKDFSTLHEKILDKIKMGDLPIYPTHCGYMALNETIRYSEEFADYSVSQECFKNHLIKGFTKFIESQEADDNFIDKINTLAKDISNSSNIIDSLSKLIVALGTIKYTSTKTVNILLDSNFCIIQQGAHINVGENIEHLPENMPFTYVNEELIKQLISILHIDESNAKRGLTKKLKEIKGLEVSDMDISAAKSKIIDYSKTTDKDGFIQLMFALYVKHSSENSSILEEIFLNSEFRVIAKDGSRHYPSEVVISSDAKYLPSETLVYSIAEWTALFQERSENIVVTEEEVRDFFYLTVGISEHIPMHYLPMDNSADDYLREYAKSIDILKIYPSSYYTSTIEKHIRRDNRFKIIDDKFIHRFLEHSRNLAELILLINKDETAVKELCKNTLHFQHRTLKEEKVNVSYPAHILRSSNIFECLTKYIVSENLLLVGDKVLEKNLNKIIKEDGVKELLIMLGAKERIEDLSLEELYSVLEKLPDINLDRGVQKTYKILREAINSKRLEQSKFSELAKHFKDYGRAYCRKDGKELEIKPISEIYYWDNDILPHHILSTKYKLELPNRVGEDSVSSIFGVKLAKDIEIKIKNNTINDVITDKTKQRILERIRYILAYRLHNSREITDTQAKRNLAQIIKDIKINIYYDCSVCVDNVPTILNEGDMVSTISENKQIFHICSDIRDIDTAFKTPSFSENITEALCISLKVTSSEMASCFRSILKNTIAENEFISRKEIAEDIWNEVDNAIGISTEEMNFWNYITKKLKIIYLDKDKLASSIHEKTKYLKETFNSIKLPHDFTDLVNLSPKEKYELIYSLLPEQEFDRSFIGEDGLLQYYDSAMDELIGKYKSSFSHQVYNLALQDTSPEKQCWFHKTCLKFRTKEQWISSRLDSIKFKCLSEDKLKTLFCEYFKDEFPEIKFEDLKEYCDWSAPTKEQYFSILSRYGIDMSNIDQDDIHLTYFDGNDEAFEKNIKKYTDYSSGPSNKEDINFDINDLTFSFGIGEKHQHGKAKNKEMPSHGGRYTSEREKHKAGLLAEQKVLAYLKHHKETFANVEGYSRNLKQNDGDDSRHYDIEYSIITDGIIGEKRFLEVKSMSSDTILMSKNEYDFARDNAKLYDLAIVKGNNITILKAPFANPDSQLSPIPETYSITMRIKELSVK